jgi:hypothetical protein
VKRPPPLSEAAWQAQVLDLATICGWHVLHVRPGRTVHGYRVPVTGDLGRGWPDVLLARERIVIAELKSASGQLTPDQARVHDLLRAAGVAVFVWTPDDLDAVMEVLR